MIQYKQILITLALLLTAVTGAWAQATFEVKEITSDMVPAAWEGDNTIVSPEDLAALGITFFEVTKAQASAWADYPKEGTVRLLYAYSTGFSSVDWYNGTPDGDSWNFKRNQIYVANATGYRYFVTVPSAAPEPAITVEPVEGKTNEWTFAMPGSDVVLTPQYAPAAQLAEDGAPAPVSGLEIAADAPIITAGQTAQGTLLYAVSTSATEQPALTAFSATLPNAKDQTAAGNYYVWYYIQGQDTPQGEEPSADNTFNDSEIMGPVMVELLTNEHTLNIKQSPNITVTVAGTAKTPTDDKVTPVTTGQEVKIKAKEGYKFRKVEVKKGAADVKITSFSIHTSSNYVYSAGTFTCSIIDILPANATNQTFEWNINSGAPVGTAIKTVSDDTKTVTILAGAVSGSITIEATAKDGGGANKLMHITVME